MAMPGALVPSRTSTTRTWIGPGSASGEPRLPVDSDRHPVRRSPYPIRAVAISPVKQAPIKLFRIRVMICLRISAPASAATVPLMAGPPTMLLAARAMDATSCGGRAAVADARSAPARADRGDGRREPRRSRRRRSRSRPRASRLWRVPIGQRSSPAACS